MGLVRLGLITVVNDRTLCVWPNLGSSVEVASQMMKPNFPTSLRKKRALL